MLEKRVRKKIVLFIMIFSTFIGIMNTNAYAGGFTNEVTRNNSYDRNKATWYAENYAAWPGNPEYYNYGSIATGGDCTNFVSQVLKYGGMSMKGYPNPGDGTYASWYYKGASIPNRSYSWTSAHWFRYYWANVNNEGYNKAYRYTVYTVDSAIENFEQIYSELWRGDVVQYVDKSNGKTTHSQVIHAYVNDIDTGKHLYVAQHSTTYDRFMKYEDLKQYLLRKQARDEGGDWFVTIQIKQGL